MNGNSDRSADASSPRRPDSVGDPPGGPKPLGTPRRGSVPAGRRGEGPTGYAKARLRCGEVREDLVALLRNELSPLRAESVRAHLDSCPECREESLEFDLAMRSFQRTPEPAPPAELADSAMKRVLAAHGWVERPSGAWERPPGSELGSDETAETDLPPASSGTSVWFRPVRKPVAWGALAAAVFVTFVLGFTEVRGIEPLSGAVHRAQKTILGRRISQVLDRATDAFLDKLRL